MLSTFCSVAGVVFWSTFSLALPYYGDVNIADYLRSYCAKQVANEALIVIENVVLNGAGRVENTSETAIYLKQTNCSSSLYLRNLDRTMLLSLLKSEWRFKKLMLLFDFTATTFNENTFIELLQFLDVIFDGRCHRCEPLVGLFRLHHNQLTRWSRNIALTKLKRDFRVVLLSTATNSVVHINPVMFGCKAVPGIYQPRTPSQFASLKVPFSKCDLKQATLTAYYNNILPFCNVIQENGTTVMKFATETEILKIMQEKFNFTVKLFDAKGWGMFVKGRWTGVLGRVFNRTSDIGLCYISRTLERLKAVSFSSPIIFDEVTFMSKSPNLRSRDWLVLSPFSEFVWLCIFLSWLLISSIFYFTFQFNHKRYDIARPPSLMAITIQLVAIFTGQSNSLRWTNVSSVRLLNAAWMLSVLILANSYSGCFYSILAVPEFEQPIDTLADIERIARKDDGRLITFHESSYFEMFVTSSPEGGVYHAIGQHMNRTQPKMVKLDLDAVQTLEQRHKTTLIATRLYLATIRRVYSTQLLHIGQDTLGIDFIAYIFPKKSPLVAPFSRIIKQMYMTGLIEKLFSGTFDRLPWKPGASIHQNPTATAEAVTQSLAPKDLRSVIILWSIGVALALVSFFNETLTYCMCTRVKSTIRYNQRF